MPDDVAPSPPTAARIVDSVLEALAAGRLPAGTRLREEALAGLFATSRTVVRDALKELALRGVVALAPNRGAAIAHPSPEDAADAYAARALIEGAMMEDLAQHVTAADIRRLDAHVAEQKRTLAEGDRRTHLRLMGEFHMLLARLHGNATLATVLEGMIARTSLMTALYPPDSQGCAIDDHEALVRHLARGEGREARAVAAHHLLGNRARLRMPARPPVTDLAAVLRTG